MAFRSSDQLEGPYLVLMSWPAASTEEQADRALEAAHRVFEYAGVDPVEADLRDSAPPERQQMLAELWEAAEEAATEACWAPREGPPEPTVIGIYVE